MSIIHSRSGVCYTGEDTRLVQAFAIAGVLRLHALGLKAKNVRALMLYVEKTTGQRFKRHDYMKASEALQAWARAKRDAAEHVHE